MKVIFATTNLEKIVEARIVLKSFGYEVEGKSFDFNEPCEGTMEEIAKIKLEQITEESNVPIFVDDSGIFLEAYPYFPGVLSKRIFKRLGYKGLEKLLLNENRRAFFYGVIAVKYQGKIEIFSGQATGTIKDNFSNITEDLQFPFDPIFIPDGDNRVLAEMSVEERVHYSYRRIALQKLGEWLNTNSKDRLSLK